MNRMYQMRTDFLEIGDELFQVIRTVKESNNPNTDKWKESTGADRVFRKDERLYFCIKVDDAEIIEETINEIEE